jgi:hypothetical protein
MTMVNVTVRTAEKDDLAQGGSQCKFYRTYSLDEFWVVQYGSMRGGIGGGQFKVTNAGHVSRSASAATDQFNKKLNDGYVNATRDDFLIDIDKFKAQGAGGGQWLENMYDAAKASRMLVNSHAATAAAPKAPKAKATPSVPTSASTPAPETTDALAQVTQRALKAIALASSEPAKALTEHSLLTVQLEEIEVHFRKARSYLSTLDTLLEEAL